MAIESGWKVLQPDGTQVADVDLMSSETRADDRTGRPFNQIRISSPSEYLELGKYQLVSPDGDVTMIQVFDEPVGGVYTVGKVG